MALGVGQLIDGRFVVEALIGEGGMATVWRVREQATGQRRALKCLSTHAGSADARLRREGAIQAQLHHPNLVSVEEVITVGENPALIMELVEGSSLDALLRQQRLSLAQVDALAAGIFAGVRAAHRAGAAHRDLKPANILLQASGSSIVPRITDFGLARLLEPPEAALAQTRTGAMLGTPQYMAPEQARDPRSADHRADIWALGCILYELACGQRPFQGADFYVLLQASARGHYTPPGELRSGLPQRWIDAIAGALTVDPSLRIQSCSALAALWGRLDEPPPEVWAAVLPLRAPKPSSSAETAVATFDTWLASNPVERYRLPLEADPFIGRTEDLQALSELVGAPGLVTVVGTGGTGKTRLAVRLGWSLLQRLPGGAWFCDLSAARTEQDLCAMLGELLGIQLGPEDPVEQLAEALRGRARCMVIFDNFEQIIAEGTGAIRRWLSKAEQLTMLVTSRAPLGLPGEQLLPLGPLPLDPDATELFAVRARAGRPSFVLLDDNRAEVLSIVGMLDGIPLAIELAAARIRVLSPAQIRDRMRDRFRLLAGARGSSSGRQATMRAAIDWSWALLEPWERSTLAQCSTFKGGFTLEAAEAIADLDAFPDAPWVMDAVQSLVEKSLLRTIGTDDAPRFDTFLTIRDYATEKLAEPDAFPGSGPAMRAAALHRHGEHYSALLGVLGPHVLSTDRERIVAIALESDNLAAACRRAIRTETPVIALNTSRLLWDLQRERGPLATALELAEALLGMTALSPEQRLQAQITACDVNQNAGFHDQAEAHYLEGIALVDEVGIAQYRPRLNNMFCKELISRGRHDEAQAAIDGMLAIGAEDLYISVAGVYYGGVLASVRDPPSAKPLFQEALEQARQHGFFRLEQSILLSLGSLFRVLGQLDEAWKVFQDGLTLARKLDQQRFIGVSLLNIGTILQRQGRRAEARTCYEEGLQIARTVGSRSSIVHNLHNLASVHHQDGELQPARALFERAFRMAQEIGSVSILISAHTNLGTIAAKLGQPAEARAHLEKALEISRGSLAYSNISIALMKLAGLHVAAGELQQAHTLAKEARALAVTHSLKDGIVALGWLCAGLAEAFGETEQAAELRAAADAEAEQVHPSQRASLSRVVSELLAPLREP
jgi:predicted ATPase/Tfp pilus assembly protein PilF